MSLTIMTAANEGEWQNGAWAHTAGHFNLPPLIFSSPTKRLILLLNYTGGPRLSPLFSPQTFGCCDSIAQALSPRSSFFDLFGRLHN